MINVRGKEARIAAMGVNFFASSDTLAIIFSHKEQHPLEKT